MKIGRFSSPSRPSSLSPFFFVFQGGGRDQCTCEFPLRNASHLKSRLRSKRNVACESKRLFRPLFYPPRAEKRILLSKARRNAFAQIDFRTKRPHSNKILTVNRTERLLSLSISFGIPFLSHATRYCSLSVEIANTKTSSKRFIHNFKASSTLDCEQSLFSSDLGRGVHASANVERRSRVRRETRAALKSCAFSHARGHLRISHVLLDGPRKKRDCS